MELDPTEWQLVSDPFETLRIFRSKIPLIEEDDVGSVQLLITVHPPSPPSLLLCHDIKAFSIHIAELRLLHGDCILNLGLCSKLGKIDSDGFWHPPFFREKIEPSAETKDFIGHQIKEASYRLKHAFHAHRGTIRPEGLDALRRAIEIVSR